MSTAGICELKAQLSRLLREVRYQRAVRSGWIRPASMPRADFRKRWKTFDGLGLPAGTGQALLDADRADARERVPEPP